MKGQAYQRLFFEMVHWGGRTAAKEQRWAPRGVLDVGKGGKRICVDKRHDICRSRKISVELISKISNNGSLKNCRSRCVGSNYTGTRLEIMREEGRSFNRSYTHPFMGRRCEFCVKLTAQMLAFHSQRVISDPERAILSPTVYHAPVLTLRFLHKVAVLQQ